MKPLYCMWSRIQNICAEHIFVFRLIPYSKRKVLRELIISEDACYTSQIVKVFYYNAETQKP